MEPSVNSQVLISCFTAEIQKSMFYFLNVGKWITWLRLVVQEIHIFGHLVEKSVYIYMIMDYLLWPDYSSVNRVNRCCYYSVIRFLCLCKRVCVCVWGGCK